MWRHVDEDTRGMSGLGVTIKPLDLGLMWDVGAPHPVTLVGEFSAATCFYLSRGDSQDSWAEATLVEPGSFVGPVGVIEWKACEAVITGRLGEGGLADHWLWSHGLGKLRTVTAVEVMNSPWVVPGRDPDRSHDQRHIVLFFHDSTLEVMVRGYAVRTEEGTVSTVATRLAEA